MHQDNIEEQITQLDAETHMIVHREIITAIQTGQFWSMWDDDLYADALHAMWGDLVNWCDRVPIGIA